MTAIPLIQPITEDAEAEALKGLYMPNEVEAALLRQKIDQLEKDNARHEAAHQLALSEVKTLLEQKHQAQSGARTLLEQRVNAIEQNNVALFGKEGISKGVIADHTASIGKLWGRYNDLKTRYWKLIIALVSAGALGGGAVKLFGL